VSNLVPPAHAHFSSPVRITSTARALGSMGVCYFQRAAREIRPKRPWRISQTARKALERHFKSLSSSFPGTRIPYFSPALYAWHGGCIKWAWICELRRTQLDASFALTPQLLWRECLPKTPRLAGCGATSPLFFCPGVLRFSCCLLPERGESTHHRHKSVEIDRLGYVQVKARLNRRRDVNLRCIAGHRDGQHVPAIFQPPQLAHE
jgi:hypothetical protein